MDPFKVMEKYSADAIRYWAASTKLGEDLMIDEDKIAVGQKLVNKIWNVAGFSYLFLNGYNPPESIPTLVPTDKWALSRLQRLIPEVTDSYENYDHSSAKSRIEDYFWNIITDNYLEMVKNRLYDKTDSPEKESVKYTLYQVVLLVLKMLAPIIPYVTEEIFQLLFKNNTGDISIHLSDWPKSKKQLINEDAEALGDALIEIATASRRYKSKKQLPIGTPLLLLKITTSSDSLLNELRICLTDIKSVTRANGIELERNTEQVSPNISVDVESDTVENQSMPM